MLCLPIHKGTTDSAACAASPAPPGPEGSGIWKAPAMCPWHSAFPVEGWLSPTQLHSIAQPSRVSSAPSPDSRAQGPTNAQPPNPAGTMRTFVSVSRRPLRRSKGATSVKSWGGQATAPQLKTLHASRNATRNTPSLPVPHAVPNSTAQDMMAHVAKALGAKVALLPTAAAATTPKGAADPLADHPPTGWTIGTTVEAATGGVDLTVAQQGEHGSNTCLACWVCHAGANRFAAAGACLRPVPSPLPPLTHPPSPPCAAQRPPGPLSSGPPPAGSRSTWS